MMKTAFNTDKIRYRFRMVVPSYPAFNIYSAVARTTTALGPLCVATIVNKSYKWDAEIIDENNFHNPAFRTPEGINHLEIHKVRPADIVGLYGGLTSTIPRLYALAKMYKQAGIATIAGGQHFIDENVEEALANNVDYVVMGEGEETIVELLAALENGTDLKTVKGLAFKDGDTIVKTGLRVPLLSFDQFPLPDFSLVLSSKISLYPVERIRGCGMECEFCTVKGKPRPAAPERLMTQMAALYETRKAWRFFVVDDLFGQQREETLRLCQLLADYQKKIRRRFRITVQIRLDKAKDDELLTAMRKAGVDIVAIGLESPIKEDLDTMNKHIRSQEMVSLARVYHKYGFLVHGMFIFGYPADGDQVKSAIPINERIKAYRTFIRKAKIDTIQLLLPVPLPGTDLRKRLVAQKRVYSTKDIGWEYYDGNFPLFVPDAPYTPEQLQSSIRKIMGKFYRSRSLFMVVFHTLRFPSVVFRINNFESGFRSWYRHWRNSIVRSGGWIVVKGWTSAFNKDTFLKKLSTASKQ